MKRPLSSGARRECNVRVELESTLNQGLLIGWEKVYEVVRTRHRGGG